MAQGYKNIIDKGIEVDAPLAIETSGHGAMRENYSMLRDAMLKPLGSPHSSVEGGTFTSVRESCAGCGGSCNAVA